MELHEMEALSKIVFPYHQSNQSNVLLNKAVFIQEHDASRLTVLLDENKDVRSIKSENQEPISYIENPIHNSTTPLLLRVPADHTKLKLSVSILPSQGNETKSLMLVKSASSSNEIDTEKKRLRKETRTEVSVDSEINQQDKLTEEIVAEPQPQEPSNLASDLPTCAVNNNAPLHISKIDYKLLLEEGSIELQNILINDTFKDASLENTPLSLFAWEYDQLTDDYQFLFRFNVWIDSPVTSVSELSERFPILSPITTNAKSILHPLNTSPSAGSPITPRNNTPTTTTHTSDEKSKIKSETTSLQLSHFRQGFNFNIEDGPEFRNTIKKYEANLPSYRKTCQSLIDELKGLEQLSKRMSNSKTKLVELLNTLTNLQFNPILKLIHFPRDFQHSIDSMFEPFERNLRFFLRDVFDLKLIQKLSSITNSSLMEGSSSISSSSSTSSSNSAPNSELSHLRKQFETTSKDFYSWLNKYLSNDKERSPMKLLQKRKVFELTKFDYLNQLNMMSNNQYLNELLEKLFKFVNLGPNPSHATLLNFHEYRDVKSGQLLLKEKYEIYLNVLLRFNSEKYQLRQMIEVSESNEELTRLIRYNKLSHLVSHSGSNPTENETDAKLHSGEFGAVSAIEPTEIIRKEIDESVPITKENVDLVFLSGLDGLADLTTISPVDDQSSDISGILYTLGGQGKQGWHKEWVVLTKGRLIEYSDWRKGTSPINKPIEIALSSVKPVNYDKRKFCFEIITSLGHKHVFQAINEDERDKWIKALYNAGQVVNTSRLESYARASTKSDGNHKGKDKIGKSGSIRNGRKNIRINTDFQPPILHQSNDRSISPVSISSKTLEESDSAFNLVRSIENSGNHICADCGSQESVEWISINFLVCFCVNCASCHRNLGSHISKIKSLKLDKFEDEIKFLLKYVNNAQVNSYLEADLQKPISPDRSGSDTRQGLAQFKPSPTSSHEDRLVYIREKYASKTFATILPESSNFLIKAVQKINIPEVIKAIGCGADVNVLIQIPASPKHETRIISLFEYSLRKFVEIQSDQSLETKMLFIISEFLILNGCKTDGLNITKDSGLTKEALEYWNQRSLKLGAGNSES